VSSMPPLCFVLMPFGKKTDSAGLTIDFDAVYNEVIKPAIADAGLDPLRADEEMTGGIIHKPMFERLILCPFAVADLTTANANVFYELGVRHAVRPATTVLLFGEGGRLPFDVAPLRALGYGLTGDGRPADAQKARETLRARLAEARRDAAQNETSSADSPIFQLVESFPDIQHIKTDVFRDRVNYARDQRAKLETARRAGLGELQKFESALGDLDAVEAGVLIDLFLSYRAVKGWPQMIDLGEGSCAQTRLPLLVPMTSIKQVELRPPAKDDRHSPGQISARTSSQDCSSSGLRSRSSRRSSRILRCHSGIETKRTSSSGSTLSQRT